MRQENVSIQVTDGRLAVCFLVYVCIHINW